MKTSSQLLSIAVVGTMISVMGRFTISPLLTRITQDLHMSESTAGAALALMVALTGLCRYPGGKLADQLSRKTVIFMAHGAIVTGFVALSLTFSPLTFIFGTAILGIGVGLYVPAVVALISDLFEENRGKALGLNTAALHAGGVLASGLAVVTIKVTSWRMAFVPLMVVLGFLALSMHVFSDEPYVIEAPKLQVISTIRRLIEGQAIRRALLAFMLFSFVWQSSVNFLPMFLELEKGFTTDLASFAFAGVFIVGAVTNPIVGWLGDQFGHPQVAASTTVIGLAGLFLLLTSLNIDEILFAVFLFAIGLGSFWPVMVTHVTNLFPAHSTAGDYGALGTIYIGFGSLGPAFVGAVSDWFSMTVAFSGLSIVLLSSIFATWYSRL